MQCVGFGIEIGRTWQLLKISRIVALINHEITLVAVSHYHGWSTLKSVVSNRLSDHRAEYITLWTGIMTSPDRLVCGD